MTALLYLLAALACPLGIALLTWLIMRPDPRPRCCAKPPSDTLARELVAVRSEAAALRTMKLTRGRRGLTHYAVHCAAPSPSDRT